MKKKSGLLIVIPAFHYKNMLGKKDKRENRSLQIYQEVMIPLGGDWNRFHKKKI